MTELLQCLFLIALGGVIWNLRRDATRTPMAMWIWAWVIAVTATFYVDQYQDGEIDLLFVPLFSAFTLAGALAFVGRPVPRGLLLVGVVLGGARVMLARLEMPGAETALGLAFEPTMTFAAAWILHLHISRDDSIPERLLPCAMGLLGISQVLTSGAFGSRLEQEEWIGWTWIALGPFVIATQVFACRVWMRRRRKREQNERQTMQRALHASEDRYRALADNNSQLILELDAKGRIEYANPRVGELLRVPTSSLLGSDFFDFVHSEDRYIREKEGTERGPHMRRWLRPNGEAVRVESFARAFHDQEGALHWVISAADVGDRLALEAALLDSRAALETRVEERTTELAGAIEELETEVRERRNAEEALRQSEERFRIASSLSSDWSFALEVEADDVADKVWNSRNLLANTAEVSPELASTPYFDLIVPEDRARVRKRFRELLESVGTPAHQAIEIPHRLALPDGDERCLEVVLEAEALPGGRFRVIGAATDVTAKKRAEQERLRLVDHLRDVQRLESLGVLADRIAHGFNNQLTVILGNASLALLETDRGSAIAERLNRIRDAAQHSSNLTEQMLIYSGKAPPALKSIHLPHLVEGIREFLEASISRNCDLQIEIASPLPLIEGDEGQLQQVAVNLVSNASDSLETKAGKAWLRVGVSHADAAYLDDTFGTSNLAPGAYVFLEVEDEGCGISADARGRIFEPFYTTRSAGRGLGLAAVLGIVQSHGGAIKLVSEEGSGTCVRALFPVSDRAAISPTPRGPKNEVAGRVLVVDDDDAVRELMAELLTRAGFEVLVARNGGEALERMRAEAELISAVVLDLDMPELDGAETLAAIRKIRDAVPVVIVTGYDDGEIKERLGSQAISGLVRKPFDEHVLSATIEDAIHRGE